MSVTMKATGRDGSGSEEKTTGSSAFVSAAASSKKQNRTASHSLSSSRTASHSLSSNGSSISCFSRVTTGVTGIRPFSISNLTTTSALHATNNDPSSTTAANLPHPPSPSTSVLTGSSIDNQMPNDGGGFEGDNNQYNEDQQDEKQKNAIIKAHKLGRKANAMFTVHGKYPEAANLFSEAIKLIPNEVRFFGNRSMTYLAMNELKKALDDALTCVNIQPTWAKGHFRKGAALELLGRLKEAAEAYGYAEKYALENDSKEDFANCKRRCMIRQLVNLGFSVHQSAAAIIYYGSVQRTANSLLKSRLSNKSSMDEQFDSEDDEEFTHYSFNGCYGTTWNNNDFGTKICPPLMAYSAVGSSRIMNNCNNNINRYDCFGYSSKSASPTPNGMCSPPHLFSTATPPSRAMNSYPSSNSIASSLSSSATKPLQQQQQQQTGSVETQTANPLTDSRNPLHSETIWVGNLQQTMTEAEMKNLFSKFGKIRSVNLMLDKHCCFISYFDWKACGQALAKMQGKPISAKNISIKYPDRILNGTQSGDGNNGNGGQSNGGGNHNGVNQKQQRDDGPIKKNIILRKTTNKSSSSSSNNNNKWNTK